MRGVASVRARAVNRKRWSRKGGGRYLVNVLAFPDELFHWPFSQHAKFRRNETDFARTAPYHGWRTIVRDELFKFLFQCVRASDHVPCMTRGERDIRSRSVGSISRQKLRLRLSWAFGARLVMVEKWRVLERCAGCHSFRICQPGRYNTGWGIIRNGPA